MWDQQAGADEMPMTLATGGIGCTGRRGNRHLSSVVMSSVFEYRSAARDLSNADKLGFCQNPVASLRVPSRRPAAGEQALVAFDVDEAKCPRGRPTLLLTGTSGRRRPLSGLRIL